MTELPDNNSKTQALITALEFLNQQLQKVSGRCREMRLAGGYNPEQLAGMVHLQAGLHSMAATLLNEFAALHPALSAAIGQKLFDLQLQQLLTSLHIRSAE